MIDRQGRKITYLRVSVTDRCDLRCVYCMAEDTRFLPKAEVLTIEELDRLCRVFVRKGIRKIRLTGGEPLVRRNVMALIAGMGDLVADGSLDELTLTTNGTHLARHAEALAAAGMRRINVSLDTLDPVRFQGLTRWGRLDQVMNGIMAAKAAGLAVKINAVALKGVNEDEFDRLVDWCGRQVFDLCLIETMPLGEIHADRIDQYLPLSEVRARLERNWTLKATDYRTGGPARYVEVAETGRRLGFITPMSHNFCESCNRVRITCSGTLFPCLGQEEAIDLKQPLRSSESDLPLELAIDRAVDRKPEGHDFVIERDGVPTVHRPMSVTGG
ncbi:GTP 3',8-cyclase MoaA [Telmatospirillum sp.]|uniref:GTP 3',8-cyclase MoaA n=1 Tax=Telmatospirillum sp. TaxID=2079197 RepID=UPI00284414FB|nr:GTP 3',8-cyclase MoaA [Telmatospirillum sp.]MDR3435114.1 GTP 3',8-cyclase MoaA [Telmatospirillum sp.]